MTSEVSLVTSLPNGGKFPLVPVPPHRPPRLRARIRDQMYADLLYKCPPVPNRAGGNPR